MKFEHLTPDRRNVARLSRLGRSLALPLVVLWVLMPADPVVARPRYKVGFEETFPDLGRVTCAVCHDADDKRQRNEFAKQLEAALGEKNVGDQARIVAALKQIGPPKDACKIYFQKLANGIEGVGFGL